MKSTSLFLVFFILTAQLLHARLPDSLNAKQWAKALSDKNDKENKAYTKLDSLLMLKDSSYTFRFLDELEKQGKGNGNYFQARFSTLKARQLIFFNFFKSDRLTGIIRIRNKENEIESLIAAARDNAYATEDDWLIAFISSENAKAIGWFDKGARIMYSLNSINLYEKLSFYIDPSKYELLAGALYTVMEYDSCIKYMHKAVDGWQKSPPGDTRPINSMNTIALCFQREKNYDSATAYYSRALQYAKRMNDTIWIGIISGNIGQLYYESGKYDTAYSLTKLAYAYSLPGHYYAETANNLQWLARIDLASGNIQKALVEIRQAVPVLQLWDDHDKNIFYT